MPRNPESCQILPVTTTSRCFDEILVTHRALPFLAPLRGGKTRARGAALPGDIQGARTHGTKRQFRLPVVDTRMRCVVRCHAAPRFEPGALPYPCIASSVKSTTADSAVPPPTPVHPPPDVAPAPRACPCRAVPRAAPKNDTAAGGRSGGGGPEGRRIGRPSRGAADRGGRAKNFRMRASGSCAGPISQSGEPECRPVVGGYSGAARTSSTSQGASRVRRGTASRITSSPRVNGLDSTSRS